MEKEETVLFSGLAEPFGSAIGHSRRQGEANRVASPDNLKAANPSFVSHKLHFISAEALVSAVKQGSRLAAEQLYDGQAPHIRRALQRVMGHREEVDDVLQDTFIEAFRHLGELRDVARLRSWLLSIAINKARHLLKTERRMPVCELIHDDYATGSTLPDATEHGQLLIETQRLLSQLDEDSRIALVLYYLEEVSTDEISKILGVSTATVKRRIAEARRTLAKEANRFPSIENFTALHGPLVPSEET